MSNIISPQLLPHYIREKSRFQHKKKAITIAILIRAAAPFLNETIFHCVNYINQHSSQKFNFIVFDGKADEKTIFDHAMHIAENYPRLYDGAIVLGGMSTVIMSQAAKLTSSPLPVIFSNVHQPEALGIMYPKRRHASNISGIAIPAPDHAGQIGIIHALQENIKKVLILINPAAFLQYQAYELALSCAEKNIIAEPFVIDPKKSFRPQLERALRDASALITLRDEHIFPHISVVTEMCQQYGVIPYTSDLSFVPLGMAIGYSPILATISIDLAQYMLTIFEDSVEPYELPIKTAELTYALGVNWDTIRHQNLSLNQQAIKAFNNTIFFGKDLL